MMAVARKEDTACWRKCFSRPANTIHTAPVAPKSSVVGDTGAVAVSGAPSFAPPKVHGKISNVLLSTTHHNNVAYRPTNQPPVAIRHAYSLEALPGAAHPHLLDFIDDGLGRRPTSAGPAMACGGTHGS